MAWNLWISHIWNIILPDTTADATLYENVVCVYEAVASVFESIQFLGAQQGRSAWVPFDLNRALLKMFHQAPKTILHKYILAIRPVYGSKDANEMASKWNNDINNTLKLDVPHVPHTSYTE